jgi:hypothetical protein
MVNYIAEEWERFLQIMKVTPTTDTHGDITVGAELSEDEREEYKAVFFRGAMAVLDLLEMKASNLSRVAVVRELRREVAAYAGQRVEEFLARLAASKADDA